MSEQRTGRQLVEIGPDGSLRLPPECVEAAKLREGDTWEAIWTWGHDSIVLTHRIAVCGVCGKKTDAKKSDMIRVGQSDFCKDCIEKIRRGK